MTSDNDEVLNIKLNDVWRTCNKIRAALFKININLRSYFKDLDPNGSTLISESKFINVFGHQLRGVIGLCEQEITELTDYFRVQDGRIAYNQLCNVIHGNVQDHAKNDDLVSGLEWEDPLHKNRLSKREHRRLCVLLMKIADSIRLRELVLRPYFQDYELVAKNNGCVTLAHFSRVLHFLGLILSTDDYILLVKRFIKDAYTVNYVAFVEEIEQILKYMDTNRLLDYSDDIITNFPGKLLDAELPKLPRPEIGVVNIGQVYGKKSSFHPVLSNKFDALDGPTIVNRIKKFVLENQLRVVEFFRDFDLLRSGFITKNQFLRGIDKMGISGCKRLYFSSDELEILCNLYIDENDDSRINWKSFEIDIEEVITIRCLDKQPYLIVESPPKEIVDLKPSGQLNWQSQTKSIHDLCEDALFKAKSRIQQRRIYLEQFFRDMDKLNIGHVSRSEMRKIILTNGILLSEEELYALERRYNNDLGFNYINFLREADPKEYAIPMIENLRKQTILVNEIKPPREPTNSEIDIVQVLAKIKGIVVRQRIRICDFMEGFDHHSELCILEPDFRRGLNSAGIILTVPEVDLVSKVFQSPLRGGYVDYKRFCQIIEEAFYQPCLERAPLIVPLQHITHSDGPKNFLNFDERTYVTKALETLCKYSDQISNLSSLFQDFDRCNCGTINTNQFLRALSVRGLNDVISSRQYEVICKCFGVERGLRMEIDYRAFLRNLELLSQTNQNYPF